MSVLHGAESAAVCWQRILSGSEPRAYIRNYLSGDPHYGVRVKMNPAVVNGLLAKTGGILA
jgi:hypothetical protein